MSHRNDDAVGVTIVIILGIFCLGSLKFSRSIGADFGVTLHAVSYTALLVVACCVAWWKLVPLYPLPWICVALAAATVMWHPVLDSICANAEEVFTPFGYLEGSNPFRDLEYSCWYANGLFKTCLTGTPLALAGFLFWKNK
nr:hypothetical protein [uncultured Pseudodesulfovibrio sp.]